MSEQQPPADSGASSPPPGAEPAVPETPPPPAAAAEIPLDSDDTRGKHFRELATKPWILSLTFTMAVIGFVIGATQGSPLIGAAISAGVLLLVLLIVSVVASSRAEEDFFNAYASARDLNRTRKGSLPPTTPLLRKGELRYAEQIMNGTLPSGLPGALGLYTYEEHTRDSDGNKDVDHYRFTVVMHDIPAAAQKVEQVYCQRRSGFRWMDGAEDVFRRMNRLELESESLDKRFEIFYGANDPENWLKQLFSPSFVVWLSDEAPDTMAFEFAAGSLCVNVRKHHDNATELDEICRTAGMIATRIADEALE